MSSLFRSLETCLAQSKLLAVQHLIIARDSDNPTARDHYKQWAVLKDHLLKRLRLFNEEVNHRKTLYHHHRRVNDDCGNHKWSFFTKD